MFTNTRNLLSEHGSLISIGFLLIFFSVFGQSVFFGVYLPMIEAELGLSKTSLGALYAAATIASSIVIISTGKGLDHYPLRYFITVVLGGLAGGCFLMAFAHSAVTLFLAFFLLRQFGQGLMVLSASTSINRYLTKDRGKAVAMTTMGNSFQLMVFPLAALTLDHYMNWRDAWVLYGLFVLFVLLPAFWWMLKSHQATRHAKWERHIKSESAKALDAIEDQWTRKNVLSEWRFYAIVAIVTISPFVGTVIFFYQRTLAESLALAPIAFAASFPFFTVSAILTGILAGTIIDKYGEKPALIFYPLIYTIGLILLTAGAGLFTAYSGMVLIGAASGIMATAGGPLLAKLYGTQNLGSIKALLFSSNILASAVSPFLFGLLMDQGYSIITLFSGIVYYSGIVWVLAIPICKPRKKTRLNSANGIPS